MLALAGLPLGVACVVVEPSADAPAAAVADVIQAPFDDERAWAELARRCDVVTVELEHVPIGALAWLAERVPVRPPPAAVQAAQDRRAEKEAFAAAGIATARWAHPAATFAAGTVVKRRFGGYDGRGQVVLGRGVPVDGTLDGDCISEELVPFDRELSIVAARGVDGTVACYPVVENRHYQGMLRTTLAPAPALTPSLQSRAASIAVALAESLDYVGVLAGWPLGSTEHRPTAMVNLIGAPPDVEAVLAVPGAHLHLYGKAPRPARKIGHVTVPAERLLQLEAVLAT